MNNGTEVMVAIVLVIAVWFLMPYVCMIAWTAVATAWSLPLFTYWQWFFISLAIRWLFKPSVRIGKVKS